MNSIFRTRCIHISIAIQYKCCFFHRTFCIVCHFHSKLCTTTVCNKNFIRSVTFLVGDTMLASRIQFFRSETFLVCLILIAALTGELGYAGYIHGQQIIWFCFKKNWLYIKDGCFWIECAQNCLFISFALIQWNFVIWAKTFVFFAHSITL